MANGLLQSVVRFIRTIGASQGGDAADGSLLRRFTAERDEAAFSALMRRHGPMVFGVCRRVLRDPHDAEDAFQATFLVLVRKAGSVGRPDLLGNWLHGVARRTALKAKTEAAKRRTMERRAALPAAVDPADSAEGDLAAVLDEEVSRLPAKYRAPFVLCYLGGKTNEEAARLLGCPAGTVASRLAWARERLRSRLTRRGMGPSVGLLSAPAASTAVPPALISSTVKAATAASMVSVSVAALTEGVLKAMFVTKVKMAAALLLAVVVFCGAVGLAYRTLAAGAGDRKADSPMPPALRPQEAPKPVRIVVTGEIASAVIEGDDLYALTRKNELLRVDLKGRKTTTVVAFPAGVKAETLTVADGKACVGGKATFYVVDLAGGKIARTLKTDQDPDGEPNARVGFAVEDRVFAVGGIVIVGVDAGDLSHVRVYKGSNGEFVKKIAVGDGVADSNRVGDRLYLARADVGGLGVFDLKEGKLLDVINAKELDGVRVGKDKAFVRARYKGGVGMIDLKTREYAALEPPMAGAMGQRLTIQAGPDGGLLVYAAYPKMLTNNANKINVVYQYDAAGKRVGETPVDKTDGKLFVGAWDGRAVFIDEKGVAIVPLAKPAKKSD